MLSMKLKNLHILTPLLPTKMMLVWRLSVGSLLPTGVTIFSIDNSVIETLKDAHHPVLL